jgi:4-hydroxybenzoate polyprenyltransferase
VWSSLIAGAIKLKADPSSISVEYILGRASLCFVHCLLLCGAGNTWNDLVDREIDARVERTKDRPLASGKVSTTEALVWMISQYLLSSKTLDLILDGQDMYVLITMYETHTIEPS